MSYSVVCKCVSDKKKFPYFLHTYPNDMYWTSAMVNLVNYLGWIYMGTLVVDDEYGINGETQFVSEAEQNGVCIAFRKFWKLHAHSYDLQTLGETLH